MNSRIAMALACCALTSACGPIRVKPEPHLPHALLVPMPTKVGLVIGADLRGYLYKETRYGNDWEIALGPGHERLLHDVFGSEFAGVEEFHTLGAAQAASGLRAIFEPRIEQYSFVTSRETRGRYYAVTIRYRLNVYSPQGQQADSLIFTGYGTAQGSGASDATSIELATRAAMRDAAAKFLVQFPEQPAGKKLSADEPIVVDTSVDTPVAPAGIEAVPIDEVPPP